MASPLIMFIDNNNVIELQSLTNSVTGVADTAATVTMTLTDRAGTPVSGQSWPSTLSHVADGLYRLTLEDDIAIVDRGSYIANIDAVGSGSEVGHWEIPVRAATRR